MTTPLNPQSYSPQRDSHSSELICSQEPNAEDMELIVSDNVDQNEEIVITNISNKILLTISDDLIFTLTIIGDNLQALIDSIRSDDQLKTDWHSWQRFVSNPNLFYVFIYDNDFGEYVRYRDSTPINHLSRIKIKNKLYANQNSDSHMSQNGLRSLQLDEPTDALICDQFVDNINADCDTNHQNSSPELNCSTYHSYTLSSPSAPLTTTSSTHNRLELPQTKASKKLFNTSTASTSSAKNYRSFNCNSSMDSETDLYEDAPTGPMYEWTQEATVTFLELCKPYSKEIAPKKNVCDVKRVVWEQISRDLNAKGLGYFDPLTCRNHFSRQRSTYTNILTYPAIANETRWPYFELMKSIIGEKPVEMARQAKLEAKGRFSATQRRNSESVMTNKTSVNQEVSELYVTLLNLVKKYINDFLTEKKYETWNKIEKEMNGAGYKWNANALRGLFHRLRYAYLNLLRSVGDEELATASWPYFRYFQGIDLTAFKGRKMKKSAKRPANSKPKAPSFKLPGKRGPGRPRKNPVISQNDSQYSHQLNDGLNKCEVTFYEYSDEDSDDEEAVENKKKSKA